MMVKKLSLETLAKSLTLFVIESMEILNSLSAEEKAKVHFIHMNHTNPLLEPTSPQTKTVQEAGFKIARLGHKFDL